jgi:hypothetical protein
MMVHLLLPDGSFTGSATVELFLPSGVCTALIYRGKITISSRNDNIFLPRHMSGSLGEYPGAASIAAEVD